MADAAGVRGARPAAEAWRNVRGRRVAAFLAVTCFLPPQAYPAAQLRWVPPGPSRPAPSPPPVAARGNLSVWIVEDTREVGPQSGPVPENEAYSATRQTVRLTAAANETVAFQLVLNSRGAAAGPFEVGVSDFAGSAGRIDARAFVSLFRAQYVPIKAYGSWFPQHTGETAEPRLYADVLVPWAAPRGGGPIQLDGTANEVVWVDIAVPSDAACGDYAGRLTVAPPRGRTAVFACDVSLTVLPVAIPGPRSLPAVCRVDPADLFIEHLRWDRAAASHARLLPDAPHHQAAIRLVGSAMSVFHEHRMTPALWGSFPKYRPTGDREVEVEWEAYDQLVSGWISGEAFADRVGLSRWAIPADVTHPDAALEGGFASPRYARLLAGYLAACGRHFADEGWTDKALLCPAPLAELTPASLDRMRRLGGILRQSEVALPLVVHAPARSLRGLGWFNAPQADMAADVGVWAPPAMWFEPAAMKQESALGRASWFMPDRPPYGPSLAIEAPAADARALPWQAFRYGVEGVWIENAAGFGPNPYEPDKPPARPHDYLIYPGTRFGLTEEIVPSARLKRLRRGMYDYELLRLLDKSGKSLMARTIASQLVRFAFTDAALDHLLDTKTGGWSLDATTYSLAREILLRELANDAAARAASQPASDAAPRELGRDDQIANLARWSRLMASAVRITPTADGARLALDEQGLTARIFVSVSNNGTRPVAGKWQLADPPPGWTQAPAAGVNVPSGGRAVERLEIRPAGIGSNPNGVYPFRMSFDTDEHGAFAADARLAVAACPVVDEPPRIDGDLSDWIVSTSNAAGDFRLCRGARPGVDEGPTDAPTLPTQAYFCQDPSTLYVAVRCVVRDREPPLWSADNSIAMDGIVPWGQDVVEILICPTNAASGTSGDLYAIQVKPNGFLTARHGCRTVPPVGPSEEWTCGARVHVGTAADAWTVEMALPLESLGSAAASSPVWGFNVTRLDARRGEYSSWSGAKRHCYAPQTMGNLVTARP